jgi:predicted amidohydrolase
MRKLTLGLVQMSMSKDMENNLNHALDLIEIASERGAEVVCLPELFTTRYFAQYEGEAQEEMGLACMDTIPGKATKALAASARKNRISLIGGSIYESDDDQTFNTSVVFGNNGKMLGKYRKTHVPQDQYYFEKEYFEPGDTGFEVFETDQARIASLICYDQWYPEAARCCALLGADIIFYPTAIGTIKGIQQTEGNWHRAWEDVMRGHAIANSLVVAAVNRTGYEDRMRFWGGSFVIDAFGKTLKRAGSKEGVLVCDIDLDHGKEVREGWRFFRNRRPECYGKIVEPLRR